MEERRKMRELKILAVLVLFTGAMYWGIEPYAHSVFHPAVKPADFTFADLYEDAKSTTEVEAKRAETKALISKASAAAGKEHFMANCAACHTLHSDGIEMMDSASLIDANGLLPPDLSNATALYDEVFLMEFIKNPGKAGFTASHTMHQKEILADAKIEGGDSEKLNVSYQKALTGFNNKIAESFTKMPAYEWLGDQGIAEIIAYLRTQAKSIDQLTDKEVTINACTRCHSVMYDKVAVDGDLKNITAYLGATPPDLSTMINSKGAGYLHTFINDPQKHLLGTGMPRVGLTEAAQAKVVTYLEKVGDPKKEERNNLGMWFIIYFVIISILAYAWKKNEFEEIGK